MIDTDTNSEPLQISRGNSILVQMGVHIGIMARRSRRHGRCRRSIRMLWHKHHSLFDRRCRKYLSLLTSACSNMLSAHHSSLRVAQHLSPLSPSRAIETIMASVLGKTGRLVTEGRISMEAVESLLIRKTIPTIQLSRKAKRLLLICSEDRRYSQTGLGNKQCALLSKIPNIEL